MKVYLLYENNIDAEDLIAVYGNQTAAENEAKRLHREYMAKPGRRVWCTWTVDEQEVIGGQQSIRDTCR